MGNPEFENRGHSAQPGNERALQPTVTTRSKEVQAGGNNRNRNMATIADDDDRLLVRIGYAPVSIMLKFRFKLGLTVSAGTTKTFLKMVNSLICHLHSRCAGFSARDFWCANVFRRPSDSSMGLVHW